MKKLIFIVIIVGLVFGFIIGFKKDSNNIEDINKQQTHACSMDMQKDNSIICD